MDVAEVGVGNRAVRADLGAVTVGDHLSEVEDVDRIADVEDECDVVVDQKDAGAVGADVADAFAEPFALGGVQAGGGLVEQDDLRVRRTRACNGRELALALAQVAGVASTELGNADQVERTLHGPATPKAAALTFSSTVRSS